MLRSIFAKKYMVVCGSVSKVIKQSNLTLPLNMLLVHVNFPTVNNNFFKSLEQIDSLFLTFLG